MTDSNNMSSDKGSKIYNENDDENSFNELSNNSRLMDNMSNPRSSYHSMNNDDMVSDNVSANNMSSHLSRGNPNEDNDSAMDSNNELHPNESAYTESRSIDNLLTPEHDIRYKIFKFINNIRTEYKLNEYAEDYLGNDCAMEYCKFILENDKEDENELNNM